MTKNQNGEYYQAYQDALQEEEKTSQAAKDRRNKPIQNQEELYGLGAGHNGNANEAYQAILQKFASAGNNNNGTADDALIAKLLAESEAINDEAFDKDAELARQLAEVDEQNKPDKQVEEDAAFAALLNKENEIDHKEVKHQQPYGPRLAINPALPQQPNPNNVASPRLDYTQDLTDIINKSLESLDLPAISKLEGNKIGSEISITLNKKDDWTTLDNILSVTGIFSNFKEINENNFSISETALKTLISPQKGQEK